MDLIVRSHQLVNEGYKYYFKDENILTVWSAPNYCYRCGNKAAILNLDKNLNRNFEVFNSVKESENSIPYKNVVPYFL